MPATHTDVTTIEGLLALPQDGMRHELLDGIHVVTPSPKYRHQRVLLNILLVLERVIGDDPSVELLPSPADIRLGPTTLVQPDLFALVPPPGGFNDDWSNAGVPRVAIEILSPSTAPRDRGTKRKIYQRAGVAEYWIVDIDARLIERWTPGDVRPEICDTELHCNIGAISVTIAVPDVFKKV